MKYIILLNLAYSINLIIISNGELMLKNIMLFNYKNNSKFLNNQKLFNILFKNL